MKRFFLLCAVIVMAASLSACQDTKPDSASVDIVYENNSTNTIEIVRTDFTEDSWTEKFPEGFVLAPNKRYEIKSVLSPVYCRVYGKAKFDNSILVDYTTIPQSEYNITLVQNFADFTSSDKYIHQYTYTFTDADYQFALENGRKIE